MRFTLFLVSFLLFFSSCFKKQIREVYSNGQIHQVYFINDAGQKNGTYTSFYENGVKRSEGQYNNGRQSGLWVQWHDNGNITSLGQYDSSGLQTGEWRFYSIDGNPHATQIYLKGKPNGLSIEYFENGTNKSVINMIDGVQDGIEKRFYENGKLQAEIPWVKGFVTGYFKEYATNNKVRTCGIRNDSGPWGFICELDTLTGDTLKKAYIRWGKLSDTTFYYRDNKPDQLGIEN